MLGIVTGCGWALSQPTAQDTEHPSSMQAFRPHGRTNIVLHGGSGTICACRHRPHNQSACQRHRSPMPRHRSTMPRTPYRGITTTRKRGAPRSRHGQTLAPSCDACLASVNVTLPHPSVVGDDGPPGDGRATTAARDCITVGGLCLTA